MKFWVQLILLLLPYLLIGQSAAKKLRQLQKENDSLRLALIQCQNGPFQRITENMDSPKFGENPLFSRKELQAKLLPSIKAKSPDKYAIALNIIALTDQFIQYSGEIKDTLIARSGGLDSGSGQPLGIRNKEIPTRFFLEENNGIKFQAAIVALRGSYLQVIQEDPYFVPRISLIAEVLATGTNSKSWAEYEFKQMPLAAVLPVIGKYQMDAKASEAAVLQYLNQ